jgi:hypothetical protein
MNPRETHAERSAGDGPPDKAVPLCSSLLVSLLAAALFYAASTLVGEYDVVARLGGSIWVFLLTVIVSMPLITTVSKRRRSGS